MIFLNHYHSKMYDLKILVMFIEITFDTILVNQFYFWNHLIDLLRNHKPFNYQYTKNPKNGNVIENFIKLIFEAD